MALGGEEGVAWVNEVNFTVYKERWRAEDKEGRRWVGGWGGMGGGRHSTRHLGGFRLGLLFAFSILNRRTPLEGAGVASGGQKGARRGPEGVKGGGRGGLPPPATSLRYLLHNRL